MALCNFTSNHHIFDVTPVENLFIQEFMLKAPGDFVKVYLYGISQCYHPEGADNTVSGFAHALGLDEKIVENAFHYWERQGILKISKSAGNNINVEYFNIKDVLYNKNFEADKTLYKYRDFNQNLQSIFEARLLSPQEYLKVYDWLELLHLPQEVVLMMVKFFLSKKGHRLNINYLDKIAEQWAKDGIDSLQKAEEYIETSESCYQDTVSVLKYLGIKRTPTKAELELYRKWKQVWNFSLDSILHACKETTKTASPSFAYLDKILSNLHVVGMRSVRQIEEYLTTRESINDKIKEVLFHAGHKEISISPEYQAYYIKWTNEWHLNHDCIILACKQCVRKKGAASLETLDITLKQWADNGLLTTENVKAYLNDRQVMDEQVRAIFERCGEKRDLTPADRMLFKKWTREWRLSHELVLLAAEYSIMAENKITFMNKILSSWHKSKITTINEAKLDHERHVRSNDLSEQKSPLKKKVDFNRFEQHPYTESELDYLFENIENG